MAGGDVTRPAAARSGDGDVGLPRPQEELLALFEGTERPLSVREIAARTRRHHTWARPHLRALVRSGHLVARTDPPSGRGRPATRYAITPFQHAAAAGDHAHLIGIVTRLVSIHGFGGRDVERFGESHGHALAHERGGVREVHRQLVRLGFTPRPVDDALHVLPLGDCPVADLVRKPQGELVCTLHRGITRGIAQRAGLPDAELQMASPDCGSCRLLLKRIPTQTAA